MTRPEVARKTLGPSLFAGALAVACSFLFALVFGGFTGSLLGLQVAYSVVITAACIATVPVASRIARRIDGGGAVRTTSWVLVGWCPYLFGGAALELGNPIVVGHWRCGTGDIALFFLALISVPFVFATSVAFGVAVDRFRLVRLTKAAAWVVVGVSVLVLAASLRRIHKVVPDEYIASLPVLTTLTGDHEDPNLCQLWRDMAIAHGVADPPDQAAPCEGVRVSVDEAHDLRVFQAPGHEGSSSRAAMGGRPEPKEITPSTVASSLRPPTVWAASQAVGTLLALALVGVALSTRRRANAWRAARTGVHGGDGWVTFEDGTPPAHFAEVATLPAGPVLVLSSSGAAPHYREHGGIDDGARFVAGSFDDVVQTAETRATDLYAFASLVGWLTLAPMLAAAVDGLLG